MTKKEMKEREVKITTALFERLRLKYELLHFDPIMKRDGRVWWHNKVIYYTANVREFKYDKYKELILEYELAKDMVSYQVQGFDNWFIQHFFTDEADVYDTMIFNMTPRITEWVKENYIPTRVRSFNRTTATSREIKQHKEYHPLMFDPKLDKFYKNTKIC